jgi:hypothetical protein
MAVMRRTRPLVFLAFIEVLLIGIWLGAIGFFSFAVPQSAFEVISSRQLVGQFVTSAITKLENLGLVLGSALLVLQFVTWKLRPQTRKIRLSLIVLMVVATALSRFWVTPEMVSLRNAMGPVIEDISSTDPIRVQFSNLHVFSVSLLMASMLAGLITLFLMIRSWLK